MSDDDVRSIRRKFGKAIAISQPRRRISGLLSPQERAGEQDDAVCDDGGVVQENVEI